MQKSRWHFISLPFNNKPDLGDYFLFSELVEMVKCIDINSLYIVKTNFRKQKCRVPEE